MHQLRAQGHHISLVILDRGSLNILLSLEAKVSMLSKCHTIIQMHKTRISYVVTHYWINLLYQA